MNNICNNLEDAIVTRLQALTYALPTGQEDEVVTHNYFRTVEPWNNQIEAKQGGLQKVASLAPYAFVECITESGERAGGDDLNDPIAITLAVGLSGGSQSVNLRRGTETTPGLNQIADHCIAALDHWHPGDGFALDEVRYQRRELLAADDKCMVMQLNFNANRIV